MRHLNYNHLLYFWTVAREGSIVKASKSLHLTPQTISGQLKLLEDAVGESLFNRVGRGLVLTETGHLVYQYAEEIFALGAELSSRIKTGRVVVPATLCVGPAIPVEEKYYAISPERKLKHPAVLKIIETARKYLFAYPSGHG